MKNIIKLLALPCIIALLMTSCSKSSDNGGGGSSDGKHLTKISEIQKYYSNNGVLLETEIEEINFTWSGNLVTKMEFFDSGILEATVVLSYNNNTLYQAVVTNDEGDVGTLRFNYTGENITSIDAVENDGDYESFILSYDNNKLKRVVVDDLFFNLTWSGNDVSRTELEEEGHYVFTYDSKNNPLNNIIRLLLAINDEDFELLSDHNVTYKQWFSDYGETSYIDYEYEYDSDQYPVSRTFTATDSNYHAIGSTEYIY